MEKKYAVLEFAVRERSGSDRALAEIEEELGVGLIIPHPTLPKIN